MEAADGPVSRTPLESRNDLWNAPGPSRFIRDGKVAPGRDGWLFLANDHNQVLKQQAGELRLSEDQVTQWQRLLETRIRSLAEQQIPYLFMVAPDAHSVYPEKLPHGFEPVDERPVHQLMQRLRKTASPAEIIYPLDEIVARKAKEPVYSKVDSHWNSVGAFVAYSKLADRLNGLVRFRRLMPDEISFLEYSSTGDLGGKFDPPIIGTRVAPLVCPRGRLRQDNCIDGRGELMVVESRRAPESTCVLFADSFSHALLLFLGESFGRTVFCFMPTVDHEVIRAVRPNVVISVMAERFLIEVPDDTNAPSIHELERAKRAAGRIRGRATSWDPPPDGVLLSVEEVESIRVTLLGAGRLMDATLVGTLAYAGLTPREACRLRWRDVKIDALTVASQPEAGLEVDWPRTVRLPQSLAEALAGWRGAGGTESRELVFPNGRGHPMSRSDWREWRDTVYIPAARASGVASSLPRHLAHTFRAIMIRSGIPIAEVMRQTRALSVIPLVGYGSVFDELEVAGPMAPDEQIQTARERVSLALA